MALFACKAMAVSSFQSPCIFKSTSANPVTATSSHIVAMSGLAMPGSSLKNAGKAVAARDSLLLPNLCGTPLHSGVEHKGSGLKERPSGVAAVRASSYGQVKEVKQVSQERLYYNVTLTVSPSSLVAKWYTTPGQYVNLLPEKTESDGPSAFFIASPPRRKNEELEFLIHDVAGTVANELINSKPGDKVFITTDSWSTGFDFSDLNSIEESQSVLMFASSYGMGPFRALIERGFEANKRKQSILYAMFTPQQLPYKDLFPEWERTGVRVQPGPVDQNKIVAFDPTNTVVLLVATKSEQESLAAYFENKGVPSDKIQVLFDGIPDEAQSSHSKVLYKLQQYPKFPYLSKKHVPVELKI